MVGAIFGAVGPILWKIAYRAGHSLSDGTGVLDKIAYITPCWVLFLGFPQGNRAYPRDGAAFLTVGVANMIVFALLVVALRFAWRLAFHI